MLLWYRVASHLGRTVQEAQATITSTEFLDWIWYLDWKDTKEFRREDYYQAQIAALIERAHFKRSRATVESKLLKFTSKEKPSRSADTKMQDSKAFWSACTGANRGTGKLQTRTPPPHPKNTQGKGEGV